MKRGSLRLKRNVEMVETALAPRVYRWANCVAHVPAQSAPVSPDHPWHTSTELKIEADARNDTHRQVVYQVQQSYYRLLNSMGQEDAARASLSNAQAVQQGAEERLAHGLATLPDVLEARSATAQAEYDLQAI